MLNHEDASLLLINHLFFFSGEVAFKALSLGPFIWAKNPIVNRIKEIPAEIPISILYGQNSWMDKTAGYQIQTDRENSYVAVEVNIEQIVYIVQSNRSVAHWGHCIE